MDNAHICLFQFSQIEHRKLLIFVPVFLKYLKLAHDETGGSHSIVANNTASY